MSRSRNWRHQLMRVKQIADQNLGRAEKTEVITEQIHALEKRIDLVGKVCGSTSKKLQAYLVSTGPDAEKRLKKIPENGLSLSMIEASNLLGADSLMGSLFKICGDAQFFLAKELMTHEYEVESNVLGPIHTILENEIPNIQKLKKNLAKLVLDMDTAKTKYHSAQKQHQQGNMSQQKVEAAKDEFEDTETRVLQVRDQLTTEMLSFTARESEFSKILVTLMEAQATYHKRALEVLERLSPQMQDTMVKHEQMPVYNYPLEDHLRRTDRHIAMVLEACVVTLLEEAMEEEGLFRIAGGASKLKKLKATFDSGTPDNTDIDLSEFIQDVHSIAGALKLYLRELPEPLMTYDLYDEWMQAAHLPHEQRLQALWVLVNKLPKPNFDNLRYLMKFFARMSEFSEKNKMSARNIAIVIGPNLIWPDGDGGPSPLTTSTQSAIVEDFINHVDYFFPGDVDFYPKRSKGKKSSACNASAPGAVPNNVVNSKNSKSQEGGSLGSGLSMAHNTLTAPLSAVTHSEKVQIDRTNNGATHSPKHPDRRSRSPLEQRCSVDSGIGSSGQDATLAVTATTQHQLNSSPGEHLSTIRAEGSSNSLSDPHGANPYKNALTGGEPVARYISPASQPPPPRSVHSDMYNTVFALQSLGDEGWSDYLTRVRTLWDGHMNKRLSVGNTGSAFESPAKSDIDFHDTMASEASSETQNAPATGSHQSSSTTKDAPAAGLQHTPPGTINAPPAGLQQTLEEVSVGTVASQPPLSKGSPSASSGSLTVESNSGGASPATLRKAGKKPAPPPPTDRHSVVPEKSPSPYHSSDNLLFSVPAAADGEKHAHPERPSAPPTVAEKPCIPSSPRADRPRGPPPDRPQGPPPDRPQGPPPQKPEKPEKPPSPAVLSKPPAIPDKPQTPPSIPEKPVSPLSTEKPQTLPVGAEKQELLRPDDGSKPDNTTQTHRQSTAGGVKPPRPNPPPPLPPRKSRGGSDKSAEIHLEDTSSSQRKSKGSPIEENTPL